MKNVSSFGNKTVEIDMVGIGNPEGKDGKNDYE